MLGLEAKARSFVVWYAIFANDGAIKEIAGVELHTGLGGVGFQDTAAGGLNGPGG